MPQDDSAPIPLNMLMSNQVALMAGLLAAPLQACPVASQSTRTSVPPGGISAELCRQPWMASGPALRSFVTVLRADQDAVANGLSLRWSSGAPSKPTSTASRCAKDTRTAGPIPTFSGAASRSPTNPCARPKKVCQNHELADVYRREYRGLAASPVTQLRLC
jgi:hypothetical protein